MEGRTKFRRPILFVTDWGSSRREDECCHRKTSKTKRNNFKPMTGVSESDGLDHFISQITTAISVLINIVKVLTFKKINLYYLNYVFALFLCIMLFPLLYQ